MQELTHFKHDISALWGQCQGSQQPIQSFQKWLLDVVSAGQLQQAVDQGVSPQLLGWGSSILCGGCWRRWGVSQRTGGWKKDYEYEICMLFLRTFSFISFSFIAQNHGLQRLLCCVYLSNIWLHKWTIMRQLRALTEVPFDTTAISCEWQLAVQNGSMPSTINYIIYFYMKIDNLASWI